MAKKRLVKKLGAGGATAKVYWSYEDQEYTVRLWCGDHERKNAEYFADSKEDALHTAAAMVKSAASLCER